jgi:hypothetical protein
MQDALLSLHRLEEPTERTKQTSLFSGMLKNLLEQA